jgi:hypothetical protein
LCFVIQQICGTDICAQQAPQLILTRGFRIIA